ncbi:MAG: hypothetical protein GY899_01695 [Verrucomicrobiaceae bacterium]|nr:hypothetical protein [Verrucomicrobiaceae bacterium]
MTNRVFTVATTVRVTVILTAPLAQPHPSLTPASPQPHPSVRRGTLGDEYHVAADLGVMPADCLLRSFIKALVGCSVRK